MEMNKRIFGMLSKELLPPSLIRDVILPGEGRGTKNPAAATQDLSLIDPDHRGVNKEIELDGAGVDMAIVVHDQGFGSAMQQSPKDMEDPKTWAGSLITIHTITCDRPVLSIALPSCRLLR